MDDSTRLAQQSAALQQLHKMERLAAEMEKALAQNNVELLASLAGDLQPALQKCMELCSLPAPLEVAAPAAAVNMRLQNCARQVAQRMHHAAVRMQQLRRVSRILQRIPGKGRKNISSSLDRFI